MTNQCSLQSMQTEIQMQECPFGQCQVSQEILAELSGPCYIKGRCFYALADKILEDVLEGDSYGDVIFRPGKENKTRAIRITAILAKRYHKIVA